MEASPKAFELIKKYEGLSLSPYQDAAGYWTVGYGHKIEADEELTGDLTKDEADYLLQTDVERILNGLRRRLSPHLGLTQNQCDALISLAFNIGVEELASSTLIAKFIKGDLIGAAAEFGKWNHCKGMVLSGLTKRREAECALFISP